MILSAGDYLLFVIAAIVLVLALAGLALEWDGVILVMFVIVCGAATYGGINDAVTRDQIAADCRSFTRSGYDYTYCSTEHIKLKLGDCIVEFPVRKFDGVPRPAIQAYYRSGKNKGKGYLAPVYPAFQKHFTTCPA